MYSKRRYCKWQKYLMLKAEALEDEDEKKKANWKKTGAANV